MRFKDWVEKIGEMEERWDKNSSVNSDELSNHVIKNTPSRKLAMWETMFFLQESLDNFVLKQYNIKREPKDPEWLDKLTTAMLEEVMELKELSQWKWWKKTERPSDKRIKEELVDILHFWLSICHAFNYSPIEMYVEYVKKNIENFDRQTGKSNKHDAHLYINGEHE